MDPDIEPLEEYLGVVPKHLAPYEFEEMVLVSDETIEWNCNWKTSVDIFSETYHVRGVHRICAGAGKGLGVRERRAQRTNAFSKSVCVFSALWL